MKRLLFIVLLLHSLLLSAQSGFSFEIRVGNTHTNKRLTSSEFDRFATTPNGKEQLHLTKKTNPIFLLRPLVNITKGSTGHKKTMCIGKPGREISLLLGYKWIASGVSVHNRVKNNFYFTDADAYPEYLERNTATTIGVPLMLKWYLDEPDDSELFGDGIPGRTYLYAKGAYEWTVAASRFEAIGGKEYKYNYLPKEENRFRRTNYNFGLGINLNFMYADVVYMPGNIFNRKFVDESGMLPYENEPDSKFYFSFGLNVIPLAKTMFLYNKMMDEAQDEIREAENSPFLTYYIYYGYSRSRFEKRPVKVLASNGIIEVNPGDENGKPLFFTWPILNSGIHLYFLRGYVSIGIEHAQFSRGRQIMAIEPSTQTLFVSRERDKANAFGFATRIWPIRLLGLGAKIDWIYRHKRTVYAGTEELQKYVSFNSNAVKRFVPSLLIATRPTIWGAHKAPFAPWIVEAQIFPTAFTNKNYVDNLGLDPFVGDADVSWQIRIATSLGHSSFGG